jgi:hypothetical protein
MDNFNLDFSYPHVLQQGKHKQERVKDDDEGEGTKDLI